MRDRLMPLAVDHAEALLEDGGPRSQATGRDLIAAIEGADE